LKKADRLTSTHQFALRMLLSLLLVAPSAAAAPADARAKQLYEAGDAAWEAGDLVAACRNFRASLELARKPKVLVRVALCLQEEQQFVRAWRMLIEARQLNDLSTSAKRAELGELIQQYLDRTPMLSIELLDQPAGLQVTLDGQLLTSTELDRPLPVELGKHEVVAQAPDHDSASSSVIVASGNNRVRLGLQRRQSSPAQAGSPRGPSKQAVAAASRKVAKPEPRHPSKPIRGAGGPVSSTRRTAAYVTGAAGILSFGAAAVLGILTLKKVDESNSYCRHPGGSCDARGVTLRDDASRLQMAGFIAAGVGALAFSGVAILLLSEPTPGNAGGAAASSLPGAWIGYSATW
jgi:hypothetical protein